MKKFVEELKAKMAETETLRASEEFIVHSIGEKADPEDWETASFIKTTNERYFGSESEVLQGDFLEIKFERSLLRFDLGELKQVKDKEGWIPVIDKISSDLEYSRGIHGRAFFLIDNFRNYDIIKDSLIVRPLNYTSNSRILEGFAFRRLGDIALVLYLHVADEGSATNTIKVPMSIVEEWDTDKTFKQILDDALENTMKMYPAKIFRNILETDNDRDPETDLMHTGMSLTKSAVPLITNLNRTNGAIAMFYPGVKEKLSELFGSGDLYVAFTSIHEAMVHKVGTVDPKSIQRHLRATNNAFGITETLTYSVYRYDHTDKTFMPVSITE